MRPHEPNDVSDHEPPTRRRGNPLFYFQQEGQRSYLRFTLLGVTVVVLIIVIPVIALLLMFFINSRSPKPEVNTNVTVQPAAPYSPNTPVIQQAPPSPAKAIKQPTASMPTPPTPPTRVNNSNGQLVPRQSPQPTPSESPP
jgi:Na+-transporting methylmalonyl-CoA/oxaloacetate decarboxylase gamma subunit